MEIKPWLKILRQNFHKVPPEGFNSVDEIMVPFKGRNCFQNKSYKWGFRIGDVMVLVDPFMTFSPFGVTADVVANLCSTLPKQKDHKVIADKSTTQWAPQIRCYLVC